MKYRALLVGSAAVALLMILVGIPSLAFSAEPFSREDVLKFKRVSAAQMSPNGEWIAYTVSVPREPGDEAGGAYSELWLVSTRLGNPKPFITGKVNVSGPRWSPDGSRVAFLMARGEKAKTQVWMIPVSGGEATQVTSSETSVSTFRWHPGGARIAYVATTPQSKREKDLDTKGYGFVFYEENLKDRNLYVLKVGPEGRVGESEADHERLLRLELRVEPRRRHDRGGHHRGESRRPGVHVPEDLAHQRLDEGTQAAQRQSRQARRIRVEPRRLGDRLQRRQGAQGSLREPGLRHRRRGRRGEEPHPARLPRPRDVDRLEGQEDDSSIRASEGAYPTLSTVAAAGGKRTVILDARTAGVIFDAPSYTGDFKSFAFTANAPDVPGDLYLWKPGSQAETAHERSIPGSPIARSASRGSSAIRLATASRSRESSSIRSATRPARNIRSP